MRVQFHRGGPPDEYVVLVRREDGRTVRLPGYDGRRAVPHHLAHFVTEREFQLTHGVFGCIAAGAMFTGMSVVGRRRRYEVPVRSWAVVRANAAELSLAEALSGVVHDAAEHDVEFNLAYRQVSAAWWAVREGPCPYQREDLGRVLGTLRQLSTRWRSQPPDAVMALRWELPPERAARLRPVQSHAA